MQILVHDGYLNDSSLVAWPEQPAHAWASLGGAVGDVPFVDDDDVWPAVLEYKMMICILICGTIKKKN